LKWLAVELKKWLAVELKKWLAVELKSAKSCLFSFAELQMGTQQARCTALQSPVSFDFKGKDLRWGGW
jgi:hypothetical protein